MGLFDIFFGKPNVLDAAKDRDEGTAFPEIDEIEHRISYLEKAAAGEKLSNCSSPWINSEARRADMRRASRELTLLQYQSDAERIRRGLAPKYHKYTEKQEKELLTKYPPYELPEIPTPEQLKDQGRQDIPSYGSLVPTLEPIQSKSIPISLKGRHRGK